MVWGKRVVLSFVLSLMLMPVVSAQFVSDFVVNLQDILSFFIDTHIADFVLYFSVFFVVMKQALEKLWKKKDLSMDEKDEKLVNVISFVVGAVLTFSLVYWSVVNNFTLLDFGPWMFVLFAGALGIMLFRWVVSLKEAKKGEKEAGWLSSFSFFNAMFLLFLLILAVKFFSPQFLGVDILSGWPFSDVLMLGALALIVLAVIMNIMHGMKQAKGEKTGIIGFFTSDWGKNILEFILWLLAFIILLYFFPWWVVLLIALAVIGYKFWKKYKGSNADANSASSDHNGGGGSDGGGRGSSRQAKAEQDVGSSEGFKIQSMHAFPRDTVAQGERVRLDALVVGGSGNFEYHWYDQRGKEIRRKDAAESALRINTMELPYVHGDGERGWLGNKFLGLRTKFLPSSQKVVRKYTLRVIDRHTKKVQEKSMKLTVLPAQEKLVFLKIVNPVSSGRTLRTGMGSGEIPLTWKLKDPFGEVVSVVWFIEPQLGESTDADLRNVLERMDVPQNKEESSGTISIRKENLTKFGQGMFTLFVQGYDQDGKKIEGLQDRVFLHMESAISAESVIITKIDGQPVTRAASMKSPVIFDIGKVIKFEAEWVQQQNAEVHWVLVVANQDMIMQNVQRKDGHIEFGQGMQRTVNLGAREKELQPHAGKEFFLVAVPMKVTLGNITELSETGFDYVKIILREHSMVKMELYAPFASQRKESPAKVPLKEEYGIMYALTDPQQNAVRMHWVCTDERGREVMVQEVRVRDSMRGEQKIQGMKFTERWDGVAFLSVEVWGKDEMLDKASCWVTVQEEVRVTLKQGKNMEKEAWQKGQDMFVIGYEKEVVFACDVTNPDAVETYTWAMQQGSKKGQVLSRTDKPFSNGVKFKTNDFVPGEYDVIVEALNKEKVIIATDMMHIRLREVTVTPYVKINGKKIYATQSQAIPEGVGNKITIEGGIQETLAIRGDFIILLNGEKFDEREGTVLKTVFPKEGVYTIIFRVYAQEITKEGMIEVKMNVIETRQKQVA